MGNFGQGVEAAPMGIAGEVAELLQFAKHGDVGGGAQCALQLGQISDLVPAEILAQDGGLERGGSHNVIVHTPRRDSDNYNIMATELVGWQRWRLSLIYAPLAVAQG